MAPKSFLVLIILLFSVNLRSQNPDSLVKSSRFDLLKTDGRNAVNGLFQTYTRPLEWKKKDWLTAGGIAFGTAALFFVDENIRRAFTQQRDEIPKAIDDLAFYFGKPQYNYGLTAGVYLLGLATKDDRIRKTGVLLITAATASGLIQSISKTVVGRARPSTNVGNDVFDPFNSTPDYHSFPSGHSILAVTTMYALGKQINKPWLKGGAYALGMLTPLSRLWTDAHWLSDVGLSVAISVVVVDTVEKFLQDRTDYNSKGRIKTISWKISGGHNQVGLIGIF